MVNQVKSGASGHPDPATPKNPTQHDRGVLPAEVVPKTDAESDTSARLTTIHPSPAPSSGSPKKQVQNFVAGAGDFQSRLTEADSPTEAPPSAPLADNEEEEVGSQPSSFQRRAGDVDSEAARLETKSTDGVAVSNELELQPLADEEASQLEALYMSKVPFPLNSDKARRKETLSLLKELGIRPQELGGLLEQTETWQSGRIWGAGLTVFSGGFFMMSAFNYANAAHGFKFSHDPEVNKLASFLMGCVIAGAGGVFGSNIIAKGGLDPKYFDARAMKDNKLVPSIDTRRGKLVEYSSFWGFSVGHALVEVMFKNRHDPAAKAAAKWASACAATLVTCLHKQMVPRMFLHRDPMLLDASTSQKKAAITALVTEMRKEKAAPLGDYMKQWGRGFKANLGIPSTTQLVRALVHTVMVFIALAGMLASQSSSSHQYELAVAGSVAIGLIWGAAFRASRAAIEEIEQGAVQRTQAPSVTAVSAGLQVEVVTSAATRRVSETAPSQANRQIK